MSDKSIETQIALFNEHLENIKLQVGRSVSHIESEQRVTSNISQRVTQTEDWLRRLNEAFDKHERIILNEGKGLVFRVFIIEQEAKNQINKKEAFRWTIGTIMSFVAVMISLISTILTVLLK